MQDLLLIASKTFQRIAFPHSLLGLVVLLSILPKYGNAQSESDFILPPLDTLVQLAFEHSALLRSQDVWIETQRQEWQLEQKSWADLISFGGTALVGTNNVLDYQQTSLGSDRIAVDRRSAVYNGGVTVRFTLGDVLNHDEKSHIKYLEYEKTQFDRKVIEQEIREEMLVRYDRFLSSRKMIGFASENVESMRMAFETAKKYFEAGNYPVAEYSSMHSKYIAAQQLLEEAVLEAKHQFRLVLALAGLK
ncbi:MAG: TolC family protein [Saprospiraceae bacterium]